MRWSLVGPHEPTLANALVEDEAILNILEFELQFQPHTTPT